MDLTKMGMIQLQNPSHPTGLLCKANQMRLAGTLCDVVIMVDSQEFHAHRTVLACTSKMFEILFHRNSQHYTLDFLSPKTFQQILEYAYTATLQAKAEDLDDLLYAAEILEIEYLEEQCLKILETIQASDDNDTEATMAEGGGEEEEDRKARYLKNIFISKHSSEESGYASVAGQSLPGPMVDQSPSVSTSFGLSAMSPTKAAVDSLMTIGQSILQGTLQPPAGPEEPTLGGGGRHPGVAEVKTEMMQVDEVPGQDSPGTAESSLSGGIGDKLEERSKEGPGTPTRGSVITSARELHYGREESSEQLSPSVEASQGPPGRQEPLAPPVEKHLGIYSVLPNHKADAVLSMPSSVTSGLHVQPALAVSMDFSTYGGLLPQGFIQRELFNKLGELAVGMKAESRPLGEQCSVCGVELPDNEAVEQHRKLHSGMKTYGCELCGKRFLDSLRLRMHLLAHSAGAKAFVCDQCGAQFSKEDALETHRQTHTGAEQKVGDADEQAVANEAFPMPSITGAQPTGKVPHSPREAASLLSERGGAGALSKCAFWQLLRPPPTPLSKGLMLKGAIWPFVDTFSLVQYLPGMNMGPSTSESAACLLSDWPPPHTSLGERQVVGGQAQRGREPFGVREIENRLCGTHTHAHTENS
nr:zinc finger and BTB domain-containing protein 16 [Meriones unguiculatus]